MTRKVGRYNIKDDNDNDETKIEIRCSVELRRSWKKVVADFDRSSDAIKWIVENYEMFKATKPPQLKLKSNIL